MSLTRKMLKAMGIEDEKIDQIIEAHSETVDGLKEERDNLKEKLSSYKDIESELEDAKKEIEQSNKDAYKVKYEAIKEEFEDYKKDIASKETKAGKKSVYEQLLKDSGVSEKRIASIIKVSDSVIDGIEIDENGKAKDADKIKETIKSEWSDFISKTESKGADTVIPPVNNGGKILSKEQIYEKDDYGRYKLNSSQRQEALINLSKTEQQ